METSTLKVQDTQKKVRIDYAKKTHKVGTVLMLALSLMMIFSTTAFAADNPAPSGVKTETMDGLMVIVWWIIRGAVLIIAAPSVIKVVQGQADENPRDRNAGFTTLIIAAIVFGATFAIQALIG